VIRDAEVLGQHSGDGDDGMRHDAHGVRPAHARTERTRRRWSAGSPPSRSSPAWRG
jgi:hypothetical protein